MKEPELKQKEQELNIKEGMVLAQELLENGVKLVIVCESEDFVPKRVKITW